MTITQTIDMDLKKQTAVPGINAVQGDAYTRLVEISLLDGGESWQIPKGASLLVSYVRGDGTGGEYDSLPTGEAAGIISGNVVTLALAPQMLTEAGLVQVNVTLTQAAQQISTFCFFVNVHPNVGAQIEGTEGYYQINGFLPMPDSAEAGQYLRVRTVDDQGRTCQVEAVDAGDAVLWTPEPRSLDLTAGSGNASRRTIVLDGPLTLGEDQGLCIRRLAVKTAPGAAVEFVLLRYRPDQGDMVRVAAIGSAVADGEGLAVWAGEDGFRFHQDNAVIAAMADSASIGCALTGSGIRVTGQLRFDDGDYRQAATIPCVLVTEENARDGDIWYALYAMESDRLTKKTVARYLSETGLTLAALDNRIDTVLPHASALDNGKVLTVADGKYVLEKPAAAQAGGMPGITDADEGKIIQVVDGTYTLVQVADSAVAAYLNAYMEEALGGDY